MVPDMSHPDVIPIGYEPGFRTSHIGRHAGGQFLGDVVGDPFTPDEQCIVIVVLHLFDGDGNHRRTHFETGLTDIDDATGRLEQLIAGLSDPEFGDIGIRLFKFEAHGLEWGLSDRGPDSDWVDLSPQDLAFHAPWDGGYST